MNDTEGKPKVVKEVVEVIDEAMKLVKFKVVEGDLLEFYKTFYITIHVDTGGGKNLVTYTFEYEKKHSNVEDPNSLMELCVNVTKDIETHNLK